MDVIRWLIAQWSAHGTKWLGTAAAIVASLLLVPELIPVAQVKWWQAANAVLGVLTVRRGFTNSRAPDDGQDSGV